MNSRRILLLISSALLTESAARAAVDFKKEILPLLEGHCVKCHKAPHEENGKLVKPKGGLRLDAAWGLLQGTKDAVPIKPKDAANSDMVRVVSLPREDDEAMPPKDKGEALTLAEIATLKAWISEGADFGGWEGNLAGKPAVVAKAAPAPAKEREHDLLYKKLSEGLQPAAADTVKAVQARGAQIAPIGPGSPLLRVDFLTGVTRCDDTAVAALAPLADHIAHLDLARTSITDAACAQIARMPRLTRLDLRGTKLTDAGIAQLSKLENLVALNLFGVAVTDEALATLGNLGTLKRICVAETKISEAGQKRLKIALPETEVVYIVDLSAAPGKAKAKTR